MTNKILMLLFSLAFACPSVMRADTEETVTIGDTVVGKFATMLTLGEGDVVLTFEDGTSQTAAMSLVSIDLAYTGGEDAITTITGDAGESVRIYSLSGQYVGNSTESLAKGIYIMNGKKVIIR